ncbi:methyltransferase domain-containing protein [Lamprobacter modestohalophilus]|uniref:methyltransferase domain-containing protein n=1 Tax=Lamprobacter modestohalophilus TaxID=1064514 RepID=UPI00190449DE
MTKEQYWKVLDEGVMQDVHEYKPWHLKNIQDAIAFSWLFDKEDLSIAEVGAGDSRLVPALSKKNKCAVIDEYKGVGNGPKKKINAPGVDFFDCMVGSSQGVIASGLFDVLFSVSVIEHVPTRRLGGFFADCHRLLKPGGLMVHLIDAYVSDKDDGNCELWKVVSEYIKCLNGPLFSPVGELPISRESDLAFRTSYATNPDSMMRRWNLSSPALTEKRKVFQSCAIEFVLKKNS